VTEPKHGHEHLDGQEEDSLQPFDYRDDLKRSLISIGNPLALLEMAHDAIIVRDVDSVVQFWNRGATDLYGWDSHDASGNVTHTLLDTKFPITKEDVDWALLNIGHWEGELNHRRKDGSRLRVLSRQALRRNEDGQPVFILEINRDVTHNSYLQLLQEVAVAASESRRVEDAVRVCLTSICVHTGWCVGRVCLLTARENEDIDCRSGIWHLADEARFALFRGSVEDHTSALEASLAGRVLKSREPVWIKDVDEDAYFSRSAAARDAGIRSAFALPIVAGSEVVAVLELFSENPMDMNEHFLEVLMNVGRQLGRVFERVTAEEAQRSLSSSLLRSQDDERRKIARELHDSAGQYLAGIKMCLDRTRRKNESLPAAARESLDEAVGMVKKCESEIRTLSYLLHPPLLDELGLASTARWFVDGFAARSGVHVNLETSPALARLDQVIELTLFRILQECLTNIHRHSGSQTATIRIESNAQEVSLVVSDQGKGIAQRKLGFWSASTPREGVGINGMRERLKELGGKLDIRSTKQGTTVKAIIPLTAASPGL
jgi:PAS domain S-box-containing protein